MQGRVNGDEPKEAGRSQIVRHIVSTRQRNFDFSYKIMGVGRGEKFLAAGFLTQMETCSHVYKDHSVTLAALCFIIS